MGSIDKKGPGGQSPLMNAVLTGKPSAVKLLLEKGADTTIAEQDGYTPMHGAGFQGRLEIAKLLIAHGLDPLNKHSDGHPAWLRSCWGTLERHTETAKFFIKEVVLEKSPNPLADLKKCKEMTSNEATQKFVDKAVKKLKADSELNE